ncbi:MAG: PQQ-binding-like beta-propeller repeat protein, partial [Bacteroidetes bacterium]|nr:PQQ-binding-like beta-propeller repeat protein [Bacteroidota bacterium]
MKTQKLFVVIFICLFSLTTELHSQASDDSKEWLGWKHKTSGMVYASPVLSNGVVYIGSMDSIFYALDAESGRKKWRFHSGNTIQSSAATYKNLVFFESGNSLFALTTGGKLKWSLDLCEGEINNQMDPWDFHHSSPCVHNG